MDEGPHFDFEYDRDFRFAADIEASPDTLRVVTPAIPPEAIGEAEDESGDDEAPPTLRVLPSAIAALAARSAMVAPAAHPGRSRAEDEDAMRFAAFGIWALAAGVTAVVALLEFLL